MSNIDPEFIIGDATNLDFIDNNSIDLIITSPPYINVDSSRYGGRAEKQLNHNANEEMMISRLKKSFQEMSRVLKKDGVIVINIGDLEKEDSSYSMIPERFIIDIIDNTEFSLLSQIIIKDEITLLYEESTNNLKWYILSRGNPFINKYYLNRYRGRLWLTETEIAYPEVVRACNGIVDTFPSSFAERIIRIYSRPGDIVLDPFGGIGTTAISAYENNRKGISVDISVDQKIIAKNNFELYKSFLH